MELEHYQLYSSAGRPDLRRVCDSMRGCATLQLRFEQSTQARTSHFARREYYSSAQVAEERQI
jgi:hypothetical protein